MWRRDFMHRLWSCVKIQKIGFDVAKVLSDIFNFQVFLCMCLWILYCLSKVLVPIFFFFCLYYYEKNPNTSRKKNCLNPKSWLKVLVVRQVLYFDTKLFNKNFTHNSSNITNALTVSGFYNTNFKSTGKTAAEHVD